MRNIKSYFIEKLTRFSNSAILPQLYDDSLSFNELQYNLLFKLNEVITRVNEVNEFVVEFSKILKEFDIEIEKVTQEVLIEMYEDGRLKKIVADVLTEYFNSLTVTSTINSFNRVFRDILEANQRNGSDVSTATFDGAYYSYLNSATSVVYQGVLYYFCVYGCLNRSHFNYDNKHILRVYNQNGELITTKTLGNMGIANSIACDNEYVYITFSKAYNNNNVAENSRNIARFKIADVFLTQDNIHFEVKTIDKIPIGSRVDCCACFNNKLYILSYSKIYKYNYTDNSIRAITINLPIENYKDLSVSEKFFCLNTDNAIFIIDKENNTIKKFNLAEVQNLGLYKMGEVISIDFKDNGDTVLYSAMHTYKLQTNQFDLMQVFKQNIFNNDIPCNNLDNFTKVYGYQGSKDLVVHCSKQSKSNNPNGTVGKEFKHIAESVVFCGYQNKYNGLCEIVIDEFDDSAGHLNTYYDEYVDLNFSNKSFKIVASDLVSAREHQYGLGGISCDCGYVYVHGLRIMNSLPKSKEQFWEFVIYLKNCTADIIDCSIPNNNVAFTAIYARRCFLNYTVANGPFTPYAYWVGLDPVVNGDTSYERIWGNNVGCTVNAHGSVWNAGIDRSVINFENA